MKKYCPPARHSYPEGNQGSESAQAIKRAEPQIKALTGGTLPGFLVLYNNVRTWWQHTECYAILMAMRGLDVVPVQYIENEPVFMGIRPGPKKELSASKNRSISAIGVLDDDTSGISLRVFHNKHARVVLPASALVGPNVRHYTMNASEKDWPEVTEDVGGG